MRYERKYKIEDLTLDLVHQIIQNHPASFSKIFPDRKVNNIYFDTPSLTTYSDNVKGIGERRKFRVRWYGTKENTKQKNNFEIKIKENELGRKEVHPFPNFELKNWRQTGKLVSQLTGKGLALNPVLMNAYHRSYYGTRDGKFRITIDSDLKYYPLIHGGSQLHYNLRDEGIIVEVKYEEAIHDERERVLPYLPFRLSKSSKYVTGMIMR